jgi:hypothetical protein
LVEWIPRFIFKSGEYFIKSSVCVTKQLFKGEVLNKYILLHVIILLLNDIITISCWKQRRLIMVMSRNRIRQKKDNGVSLAGRIVFYAVLLLAVFTLIGCRSNNDPLRTYDTEIVSDADADGDIGLALDDTYAVSSAIETGSVFAGVDPVTGEEFRGFLNFPLREVDGIPRNAVIESATLEVFIIGMSDSLPGEIFPFLVDLVDFQPPYLVANDFSRAIQPSLLTMPVKFYPSDEGHFVVIDVTELVDEAQYHGLPDSQLRFLLDFSADSGLIEIDDADADTAPLLRITYY